MRYRAVILFMLASACVHAQCCSYFLVMHDSFGDGWNGGQLTVQVNGAMVGVFAASGQGSTIEFPVCEGDAIQLSYAAADWEQENTYQIFNEFGSPVFADGPNPATGVVFTGTGDCTASPLPGMTPCSALPIDTVDCVIANNAGALGTGTDPGCANYQGGDIWYMMPVPGSGNVSVSTNSTGGLNDTGVALWTGPDCFNLTLRACDDDAGPDYFSIASGYELPAGELLFIEVFGYGGGSGAFELCVADLGVVSVDSTELPLVIINTLGNEIPNDGKSSALMEIKYNGPGALTYLDGPANVYDGHIGIGIRGATSAGYPQRPYSIETRDSLGANSNLSLLGMPQENDWVMLSNWNDRSLVRNALAFHLARAMGQYAPRAHLCEVLVDSSYKGIYLFGERIKRDSGRVDIARLNPDENSGDDLTGGYILQQNIWDASNSFQSNYSPIDHPGFDVHFLYEYPEPDVITSQQKEYIAAFVDSLETALYGPDFADPATGYRRFLDAPSFINYFLVNEVARNADGFKKSVFFHKDKNSNGGKLKAGPVWDFDWAWKNIWGCSICDQIDGSGWTHRVNDCVTDNYGTGWYIRLQQDPAWVAEVRCVYEEYRGTVLSTDSIHAWIDSVGALVQNAQARHFQKWPLLGQSGPAPEVLPCANTYSAELDTLKAWISERLAWIDANLPGLCTVGVADASPGIGLHVAPNPSDGRFTITLPPDWRRPLRMELIDVSGRIVRDEMMNGPLGALELFIQESGVYALRLSRPDGAHLGARVLVR